MTEHQILTALEAIRNDAALSAQTEDELEAMGYIVQTHKPYATITIMGHALLTKSRALQEQS